MKAMQALIDLVVPAAARPPHRSKITVRSMVPQRVRLRRPTRSISHQEQILPKTDTTWRQTKSLKDIAVLYPANCW